MIKENEKLLVLSDIHGNRASLNSLKSELDFEEFSQVIILGDLFTYGCSVKEIIDILKYIEKRCETQYILGNHDQLYFDLEEGKEDYYQRLPKWIKESVDLVYSKLKEENLYNSFKELSWVKSLTIEKIFFAHANPYEYGNWSYLNNEEEIKKTTTVLRKEGLSVGVFGHVHRSHIYLDDSRGLHRIEGNSYLFDKKKNNEVLCVNAGSTGQPRSKEKISKYLTIEMNKDHYEFSLHNIEYDTNEYKNEVLSCSSITQETKDKIISYILG